MHDDPKLSAAFAASCGKFGEDAEGRRFMPHMSLLYSDIPQDARQATVEEARGHSQRNAHISPDLALLALAGDACNQSNR